MAQAINRLLSGDLSDKAAGFLLRMPEGCTGRSMFMERLSDAYGGAQHPDLLVLDPDKATIVVDDVRNLRHFLSTRPMAGGMKTLLVIAADRMNTSAANAFLKSLEEPSSSMRIIMATDKPWELPTTILSRCQKLDEDMTSKAVLQEVTNSLEDDFSEDQAQAALAVAGGDPAAAKDVLKYDLAAWQAKALDWIADPKGAQPTTPGKGKEVPALATLFRLLQRALMDTTSGQKNIKGWTAERAASGLFTIDQMSRGISRPGIDWKTRLAATLSCLAHMEQSA